MDARKLEKHPLAEPGELAHSAPSFELRAERLAAEYLRMWGLRDPQTIATLARRWVRRTIDESPSLESTGSLTELYRAVMRRAITEINLWIDHLADEICPDRCDARGRAGLLAIELQSSIDHFPSAMLSQKTLPVGLRERLASADVPVVPEVCLTRMPTQSLDAMPSAKTLSRWREAWNHGWRRTASVVSHPAGQG